MPREMAQITESTGPNPFASSASSPTADTHTEHSKRWSSTSTYRHVEITNEPSSLPPTPILHPAPPPRTLRQSYQSSHRSLRPVSQLPPLSDPEKAEGALDWDGGEEPYEKEYFYEDRGEIKAKCLRVLLYLSGPVFLTSMVLSLWTIFALLFALLLQPVNFFRKSKTLREQTIDFVAPALKIHLSFIIAYVRDETYASYSLPLLIVVTLLAPLISIAIAISAWTAAFFWFYAIILGDPEGLDHESRRSSYQKEQHEDGKRPVLAVRNWWRRWLTKALH